MPIAYTYEEALMHDTVATLTRHMWLARNRGYSFTLSLAKARKQFQKEVREQTDATPLPKE